MLYAGGGTWQNADRAATGCGPQPSDQGVHNLEGNYSVD